MAGRKGQMLDGRSARRLWRVRGDDEVVRGVVRDMEQFGQLRRENAEREQDRGDDGKLPHAQPFRNTMASACTCKARKLRLLE